MSLCGVTCGHFRRIAQCRQILTVLKLSLSRVAAAVDVGPEMLLVARPENQNSPPRPLVASGGASQDRALRIALAAKLHRHPIPE